MGLLLDGLVGELSREVNRLVIFAFDASLGRGGRVLEDRMAILLDLDFN